MEGAPSASRRPVHCKSTRNRGANSRTAHRKVNVREKGSRVPGLTAGDQQSKVEP